jgi:cation diffusion facilitator family transporter
MYSKNRIKEIQLATIAGLVANLMLSALKVFAGIVGNSQAVIADGIHSITDSVTDLAVIIGASYWSAPPDETHPHGHGRIETAVTIFIGLVLVSIAGGMGWNAIISFAAEKSEPVGKIAFFAALISIIVKEALYRWHISVGKRLKCSAIKANAWHHRSDALSSVPAALAVAVSMVFPQYRYVDSIGAVMVCIFIFYSAFKIIWPALKELVDSGVDENERINIENIARSVERVRDIHKCRTRYLGNGIQVDLHVLVDPDMSVRDGHDVSRVVKKTLMEKCPDIVDVIIHLEPEE